MADAKRKLVIEILSDASGVKKGFGEANQAAGGLGASLKKVAGTAVAMAGVAIGVDLIKDSLKGAIADEASVAQLAQQMKNLGIPAKDQKSVETYIGKLSLMRGVADDELRPAFAQLVRTTGDYRKAQDQLSLAQDIAAAKGISVAEAADILAKANIGVTKGVKGLGVSLTDVNGNALSTDQIFAKLRTTFEGAGETAANTGEGKLRKMTVGFDEMKESIGAALLPILSKLVDFVTTTLLPTIDKFGAWLADHKPVLIAFGVVVGTALVAAFAAWAAAAITAAAATVAAMAPVLIPIAAIGAAAYLIIKNWDSIASFFVNLWNTVSDAFNNKWIAIAALVIAPMIAVPVLVAKHWGTLVEFFKDVWGGITSVVSVAWFNGIKPIIDFNLAAYDLLWKGIKFFGDVWAVVWQGIQMAIEAAWKVIKPIIDAVSKGVDIIGGVVGKVGGFVGGVGGAVGGLWPFADGGVVPGPKGAPMPILAHGGEYVVSNAMQARGGVGGGSTVNNFSVNVSAGWGADGPAIGNAIVAEIRKFENRNGPGWRS